MIHAVRVAHVSVPCSVWNQPQEVRTMMADGDAWTVDDIAAQLPDQVGQEENPFIVDLERRMKEMAEKKDD